MYEGYASFLTKTVLIIFIVIGIRLPKELVKIWSRKNVNTGECFFKHVVLHVINSRKRLFAWVFWSMKDCLTSADMEPRAEHRTIDFTLFSVQYLHRISLALPHSKLVYSESLIRQIIACYLIDANSHELDK